jgi:hypothetical protein
VTIRDVDASVLCSSDELVLKPDTRIFAFANFTVIIDNGCLVA